MKVDGEKARGSSVTDSSLREKCTPLSFALAGEKALLLTSWAAVYSTSQPLCDWPHMQPCQEYERVITELSVWLDRGA